MTNWPGIPYRLDYDPQAQANPADSTSSTPAASSAFNASAPASIPGVAAPDAYNQNFSNLSQAIQRVQSPYEMFGAHGYLQDNHPGMAHVLNNVFLNAAMTPEAPLVSGEGNGITRALQGVLGGRQAQYQHQLQQALLPVELAQRQLGYQKSYLDVLKDRSQIGEADANAQMNTWRAHNFERLSQQSTSPYSQTRVGQNGFLYGTRKDTGQEEVIPGQPGLEGLDDAQGQARGAFPVPGTTGRNPTITSLAADVANGVPGAENKLRIAINAQTQIVGAGQGARNKANEPVQTAKEFLTTQDQAVNKMIGPEPTNKDYDSAKQAVWDKAMAGQLKGDPLQEIAKIPSLEDAKAAYNSRANQIKTNYANYVASGLHRQGVPFDMNKIYPSKGKGGPNPSAQVPSSAAAPANIPGVAPRPDLGAALDQIFPRQP